MTTVERIMKLLNESNMNGSQLEKELGLSTGVVSAWNRGKYLPSTDAIVKIANYFHVTTDYLLGLDDSPVDLFVEDVTPGKSDAQTTYKRLSSYLKFFLSAMGIKDVAEQDRLIKLLNDYSNSDDADRSKMLDLIEFAHQYAQSR